MASRLGNLVHMKTPTNYVKLHLSDASDQEFLNSELEREGQAPPPQPQPQHPQPPPPVQRPQSTINNNTSTRTLPPSSLIKPSPPVGSSHNAAPAVAASRSMSAPASNLFLSPQEPAGDVELHPQTGHPAPPPPASVQTMVEGAVKLVTMLNFMKVELGDRKTLRSKEQWRAAAAEFIGTLLFVYLGCGSVVATGMLSLGMSPSRLVAIALAHGLAIAFLAGATGAISGGHLNPAVTLAFVIAGKETLLRAGLYVSAQQLLGAVIGAALLRDATPMLWVGALGSHDLSNGVYPSQAFLMETILTFVLIFVIFGVAVDRRGPGVIAPLPIGFAVLVDHLVGVPYTGASMNPARSFGPAVVSGVWSNNFWVYWFGPCFGAAFASALYRYVFLEPVTILPMTSTPASSSRQPPSSVSRL